MEFPLQHTTMTYIVEERSVEAPHNVMFAWSVPNAEAALKILAEESRQHSNRLYRVYFSVESE